MSRSRGNAALMLTLGLAAIVGCSSSTESSAPPTGLAASSTAATTVHVTWTAAADVDEYVLERAEGATGAFAEIARPDGNATSYDDTGLSPSTSYRYHLAAVRGNTTSAFTVEITVTTGAPSEVAVTTDITANTTWTADHIYRLIGFRKVATGATLTIEAGTRIIGDFNTLGSSLFVLRGARIVAIGTETKPIVFTSSQPVGSRQPGDWGGLILVGNALNNRSGTVNVEGTGTSTDNPLIQYNGGTNNADNSGTLKYVRVEFAGFATVQDAEFNSFSFAAVGSGTTLDYLESLNGLDDSYEFWGGAVDARHLVSYDAGDDHFDMSEGYSGRQQFLIAYQSRLLIPRPGAGFTSADPQGIENDGCAGSGCDLAFNSTPFTIPVIANFTLVGTGPGVVPAAGGYGAILRRGTGGHYVNGIITRWPSAGIGYRDADSKARETAGLLSIKNVLVAESPLAFQAGQQAYDAAGNAVILDGTATTAGLFTKFTPSPTGEADFDWSLSANSPARTGGLTTFSGDLLTRAGAFVTPTAYRGAADPNATTKWWEGWTYYARN